MQLTVPCGSKPTYSSSKTSATELVLGKQTPFFKLQQRLEFHIAILENLTHCAMVQDL